MRIYERLPGRAHAAQPQRKRYDGVIASLARRPIVDAATERANDQIQHHQAVEGERSDA